ncbi:MAG: DNA repair protein RecN [Treponema sp. GWB1_62_6]|nr:MAG: DNA repair protein RecN [Treponema sp. GWA1_62_8]OHE63359.1 MAG: DNA repair protein RecN [Treponema sp. GWC1_61_84]OHE67266.1 MAG: DNA repair protein RecN [Treponema sp. GWB1_62_6]HCM25298.1 DNA repair protein RecN [Treponema sp.]
MLEELVIRDFALIDRLSVEFDSGLNIVTGETGAGKSIIIGALSFLLGAKADIDIIRTGSDETSVSGVILIGADNADAQTWLAEKGIGSEDGRIVLRRVLKRSNRGSAYVQETPVSRSELALLTSFLFDIHGQHEHQALLRIDTHRRYLDRFAGIEGEVKEFTDRFYALCEGREELEALAAAEKGRDDKAEILAHAVEEIGRAALFQGEGEALEAEAKRLADFDKLAAGVGSAAGLLFEDEGSALLALRKAKAQLDAAEGMDTALAPIAKRVSDLFYEAEDAFNQLRAYKDDLRHDPERLEAVEERLALLFRLKKKYGRTEEEILEYAASAAAEIEALGRAEADRTELEKRLAELEKEVSRRAATIREKRVAAALTLGERITSILATLGMPKSRFSVSVQPKGQGSRVCNQWGADEVQFLISPNIGEPLRELVRIASGGELSRVMLAVKTVLADSDTIETLVFDEIDTGIGGEVALAVGKHLAEIGKHKQIFCITHLASIAVRADNHLMVEKIVEGNRTTTILSPVDKGRRREEIARMLAGDSAGNAALAHADELLVRYGQRS